MSDQMKAEAITDSNPVYRIHELMIEAVNLGFKQTGDIIFMQDKNEWVVEGIQYVLHSGDANYPETMKPIVTVLGCRAAYKIESLYRSAVPLEYPNRYKLLEQKILITEHGLRKFIISEDALKNQDKQYHDNAKLAAEVPVLNNMIDSLHKSVYECELTIKQMKDAERIRKARKPAKRGVRNSKK